MIRIKVLSVGRPGEGWLEEGLRSYERRLSREVAIQWVWAKNDEQLVSWLAREPRAIALDGSGTPLTSEAFAAWFDRQVTTGGARITIAIGGAEGLPTAVKERTPLVSFSPLTFPHQIIRLLLVEQIYRSVAIGKGSPYHK